MYQQKYNAHTRQHKQNTCTQNVAVPGSDCVVARLPAATVPARSLSLWCVQATLCFKHWPGLGKHTCLHSHTPPHTHRHRHTHTHSHTHTHTHTRSHTLTLTHTHKLHQLTPARQRDRNTMSVTGRRRGKDGNFHQANMGILYGFRLGLVIYIGPINYWYRCMCSIYTQNVVVCPFKLVC